MNEEEEQDDGTDMNGMFEKINDNLDNEICLYFEWFLSHSKLDFFRSLRQVIVDCRLHL